MSITSKTVIETAQRYVEAKIDLTKCQQDHFRQLCAKCKKYVGCKTYQEYVHAWVLLQEVIKEV